MDMLVHIFFFFLSLFPHLFQPCTLNILSSPIRKQTSQPASLSQLSRNGCDGWRSGTVHIYFFLFSSFLPFLPQAENQGASFLFWSILHITVTSHEDEDDDEIAEYIYIYVYMSPNEIATGQNGARRGSVPNTIVAVLLSVNLPKERCLLPWIDSTLISQPSLLFFRVYASFLSYQVFK